MPQRLSRHVFITKDDFDLITRLLDDFIEGVKWNDKTSAAIYLLTKLQESGKLKRFTIEVENCYEIVPAGQRLERKLGYSQRAKRSRGRENEDDRGAP